jgi:hypothetical protein
MTPQDKANELVEQFSTIGLQQRNEGVACALICVDEILLIASPNKWIYHYSEDGATILEQWPEKVFWWWVKQEIEKL